jgi:DNA-binding NtrC family response regulator
MATKEKILCVDDDHNILKTLRLYLQNDYDVTVADDSSKGLKLALTGDYKVIFLDYHMPGLRGLDIAAKVEREGTNCLCILLTSHADAGLAVEVMNNDVLFKYMLKPFKRADLLGTLEEALDTLG